MSTAETISLTVPSPTVTYCAKCHVAAAANEESRNRLFRCVRCKVARYCGRECQRQHLSLHKHSCKAVALLRQRLEESSLVENQSEELHSTLANLIVEMTYRSSALVQHAAEGYAIAIGHFLKSNQEAHATKIIFLLAVLGCDDEVALSLICAKDKDEPFAITNCPRVALNDEIEVSDDWNATYLVILLFIRMKHLGSLRVDQDNFDRVFLNTMLGKKIKGNTDAIMSKIRQYLVGSQAYHAEQVAKTKAMQALVGPYLLEAIQYCIPLSPDDAQCLFDSSTPTEFWLLLQDLFFLTPGVNELLDQDPQE